ncbi:hypothetical protein SEA_TOMAS_87 [Streptomyces phage Tomas]|uniref:Uncharacterized protein n=1 Tax=Streptomyces phage Tomas TaxID=2914443 RepID=A0AA49H063_9CAUD|nr:hypothetical protein PP453_gp192 [Streptomyces phage Tomas]UMO76275.1 hypothetical protein SEA_TOMAS_87 [Streptomyces phage Tomas]
MIGPIKVIGYIPEDKTSLKRGSSKYIVECLGCGSITNKTTGDMSRYSSGKLKSGCVACGREKLRTDGRRSVLNQLFNNYKGGAAKRLLAFELNIEEFEILVSKPCSYCGFEGSERKGSKDWHKAKFNGIDRVNNEIGYTIENSVSCCSTCNFAKRFMTTEEFFCWAKRLASHSPWDRVQ